MYKAESTSPSSLNYGYMAKKSPVRTKSKVCTTKDSREIHRANVSPRNQDSKSTTNMDDGIRAGEPPKETAS